MLAELSSNFCPYTLCDSPNKGSVRSSTLHSSDTELPRLRLGVVIEVTCVHMVEGVSEHAVQDVESRRAQLTQAYELN